MFISGSDKRTKTERSLQGKLFALGALMGVIPALLGWLAPTGNTIHSDLVRWLISAVGQTPARTAFFALAIVGIALLVLAAFASKAVGYEEFVAKQLRPTGRLFSCITGFVVACGVAQLFIGPANIGLGILLLALFPAGIWTMTRKAPGLLADLYAQPDMPTVARILFAVGGAIALGVAIAAAHT